MSSASQNSPSCHIKLLQKYLKVAPFLLPGDPVVVAPYIWHTDLHAGNIYVDKGKASSVVDWEGIWAAPLILRARHPRLVDYDGDIISKPPANFRKSWAWWEIQDPTTAEQLYHTISLRKADLQGKPSSEQGFSVLVMAEQGVNLLNLLVILGMMILYHWGRRSSGLRSKSDLTCYILSRASSDVIDTGMNWQPTLRAPSTLRRASFAHMQRKVMDGRCARVLGFGRNYH